MAPLKTRIFTLSVTSLSLALFATGCGNGIHRKFHVVPETESEPTANVVPANQNPSQTATPTAAELDPLNLAGLPEGFESITVEQLSGSGLSAPVSVPLLLAARTTDKVTECHQIAEQDRIHRRNNLRRHGPCVSANVVLPFELSPVHQNGRTGNVIAREQDNGAIRDLYRNVTYTIQTQIQFADRQKIEAAARQLLATRYGVSVEKVAIELTQINSILPRSSFPAAVHIRDSRRGDQLATTPISGNTTAERALLSELSPSASSIISPSGSVTEGSGAGPSTQPMQISVTGPQGELEPTVPALISGSAPQATSARVIVAIPQRVASNATAQEFSCDMSAVSRDVRAWTEILRRTHFRKALSSVGECQAYVDYFHRGGSCSNNGIRGDFSEWNRSEIESQWRVVTQSEQLLFEEMANQSDTWCGAIADANTKRLVISDAIRYVLQVNRFFRDEELALFARDHLEPLSLGQYQPLTINGPVGFARDPGRITLGFNIVPQTGTKVIRVIPGRRFVTAFTIPLNLAVSAVTGRDEPANEANQLSQFALGQLTRLQSVATAMERASCLPGQSVTRDASRCVPICAPGHVFLLDHERDGSPILESAIPLVGRLSNKCFPTYTAFESYGRFEQYRPGSLPNQNPNRIANLLETVLNAPTLYGFMLFNAMSEAIDRGRAGPNDPSLGISSRDRSMVSIPLYGTRPTGI